MPFITAIREIEEPIETSNGQIQPQKYETIKVDQETANILLNGERFAQRAWKCLKCGEIHREKDHGREPPFCQNPNCNNKKLTPIHPTKHHEIADLLTDVNKFLTTREDSSLYLYKDGVYENGISETIVRENTRKIVPRSKQHLVNEVVDKIKDETYIKQEKMGLPPRKIAVENGVLDLDGRNLEPHDPKNKALAKIPHKYDPEADCPEIKKFIKSLVSSEKDVKKIQEMLGYTLLTENPLNKAFMGLGPGSNGRSTLFNLFIHFLGKENVANVGLSDLIYDKFASYELVGKLANFCADIGNRKIKDSKRFKRMTGEDPMRAQKKHESAFKFTCYATPWFSANELPETEDKTRAWYRRWVIINFPYTFTSDPDELEKDSYKEKDPELPEKLETEEEFSGLLNWALEGLERVLENKKFTGERSIPEKRELWELESDPVAEFLEKWCFEYSGAKIPKEVVEQAYNRFCQENDYNTLSRGPLTKRLKKHGVGTSRPRTENHNRLQCYDGFLLKEDIVKEKDLVRVVKPFAFFMAKKKEKYLENIKQNNNDPDQSDQKQKTIEKLETDTVSSNDWDCDECGMGEAEYSIPIDKENGEILHLCEECYKEMGYDDGG